MFHLGPMAQHMFCIKCGKEAIAGTVFCADCTSRGEPLASAPDVVTFEICPSCGKVKHGGSWLAVNELERHMVSEIRAAVSVSGGASLASFGISGLHVEENSSNAVLSLTLVTHGVRKEETLPLRVRVLGNTCPTCSRRSGRYFESTIQLRARGVVRMEALAPVLSFSRRVCEGYERSEEGFFVSEIRETRGGYDLLLSSNSVGAAIAKKIAQKFGAEVVSTRKLYGRRNGREVYRTTFLIRVAMFRAGDYVEHVGEYCRVVSAAETIVIEQLRGRKRIRVAPAESDGLRLLGGKELEGWAEVVSFADGVLAAKDSGTLDTLTVMNAGEHQVGSRIRVVRLGDSLYEIRS